MPRDDTLFLVITSCIASQLKDLSRQVLQDGSEVNYRCNKLIQRLSIDAGVPHTWSTGTNTLGVVALLQETMNTTNREL